MIRRVVLALTAVALLAASVLAQPAAQAASSLRIWPRHVYAPYFETWTTDSIPAVAWKSEARYFSLAFLQTADKGSCALTWNGTKTQPVPGPRYQGQIAALRQLGGDVMPTFGGFSADSTATEIADSCTSVSKIAADYEAVIKGYRVTRLDMDVEVNSLDDNAGIDRRNKAIALVEAWARHVGWPLRIEYTLPVEPAGLEANALHVLKNAVANGARVDTVNIMTFDYYLDKEPKPLDMGGLAITAANNVHRQLAALYPEAPRASCGRWRGSRSCPASTTTRARPRSPTSATPGGSWPSPKLTVSACCRPGPSSGTTAAARVPSTATRAPASSSRPGPSATCSSPSPAFSSAGTTPR